MSESTSHAHGAEHHGEHAHHGPKNPVRTFAITLICLLALTFVTVGAAKINFGAGNTVIALGIATLKASLVALIFMHLRWDKPVNGVLAMSGFLFLGIMLLFCLLDFDTRRDPDPQNLPVKTAAPAIPGQGGSAAPANPTPAGGNPAAAPEHH